MASRTSSSHISPHSAFLDLLDLLRQIPHPSCVQEDRCNKAANLLEELKEDVVYIQKSLEKLSKFEEDLGKHVRKDEPFNFPELTRAVQHLKNQLPCASYYQFPTRGDYDHDHPPADNSNSTDQMIISREYDNLTLQQKKCLWCFWVFPESAEIKKRVLINWWIGEGLLQGASTTKSRELVGEKLLGQLQLKHFIKRVEKKRRGSDSWRMEPSVRLFLSTKAKEDDSLFDLDQKILDGNAMLLKSAGQVGSLDGMVNPVTTVFNVSKPSISESEARTLASMTSLIVLHLGRSQITQKSIQVSNLKLITGRLDKMKRLRLLSFQGIPSLRELPGSICCLSSLMVIDLRACQALESLPLKIGDLKNLRHLDMSGCHLLQQMPIGIRRLANLEVLKGFVIGHKSRSCTLGDLRKLEKLHKLSIFVSGKNFPQNRDLKDLANIKRLVKLKIVWNPAVNEDVEGPGNAHHPTQALKKLEKLDLWCTPNYVAPNLLAPTRFPRVKKLYVRGSDHINHLNYNHSEEAEEDKWNVEMLRLRFLPNLEMSWEDLNRLFPKLSYLELQDCPKLQFSQYCDDEGVWKDQNS